MHILLAVAILALGVNYAEAARGGGYRGGGSRSSSSRISSSRSSSSSSSFRSSSTIRYYRGPTYISGTWKSSSGIRTAYGVSFYMRRSSYYRNPDKEPKICYNEVNLHVFTNATLRMNETYGYFVCPEADQPDDWDYCCGDDTEQRCCSYADVYPTARIVGIVIGVVSAAIIIGMLVYCICFKKREQLMRKLFKKSGKHPAPQLLAMTTTAYKVQPFDELPQALPYSSNPVEVCPPSLQSNGVSPYPDSRPAPPPLAANAGQEILPSAPPPPYSAN